MEAVLSGDTGGDACQRLGRLAVGGFVDQVTRQHRTFDSGRGTCSRLGCGPTIVSDKHDGLNPGRLRLGSILVELVEAELEAFGERCGSAVDVDKVHRGSDLFDAGHRTSQPSGGLADDFEIDIITEPDERVRRER